MSWSWKVEFDRSGTFWRAIEPDFAVSPRFYIYDRLGQTSRYAGQSVIDVAIRLDPISCRLYRLVYGSLP